MTTTSLPAAEPRPPALPEELIASTAFLLARVGYAIKGGAIAELEAAGFSIYQYSVLAILGEKARASQATVADALKVDRGQLVGILDELEERGLVERRRDPDDRRRHMVSLTADGKRQLVKLRAVVRRLEDTFLEPLGEKERAALHESLLKVACRFDCRFERPA